MSINIGPPSVEELRPRITVIGVGGAGGNAIANMISSEIEGVDFIVANTDAQALNNSIAEHRIQLGPDITQGLGAGSRPEVGRAAAEETVEELERALDGVNMVFIAAGMGGGTGTGAAPVIAEAARRKGVLTVGVVTKPFLFEGTRRMRSADAGIEELQKHVDTLIVIPNQNLFLVAKAETTFKEAFALADEVLQQGVRSITDLMVMPGLINLDFADVRSVMGEMGKAMMGTGEAEGENRALEAAERAIANPLLDGVSMQGAKGVIISIIGGEDMKLLEVDEAANHIRELVDPDANIIWGSAFNPDLQGKIRVSVVATGIEQTVEQAVQASRPLDFSAPRGPKRPVLPVPTEDERAVDAAALQPQAAPGFAAPSAPPMAAPAMPQAYEPTPSYDEEDEYDDTSGGSYASLSGDEIQTGELTLEEEEDDGMADDWLNPAASQQTGMGGSELELTLEAPDGGNGNEDELLLDASRLAAQDEPPVQAQLGGGRRRGILGGEAAAAASAAAPAAPAAGGGAAGGGSTLFERMANLSRGAAKDAVDDDDDDPSGSSLSIPRFLGRQNNQ
ncbi:cell division protein FtsZ [Erythrobacter sp. SG61-1L]|uniref:cell division protein FtsZ n=1 Tax=Erythrobacter sp. SG61-1L TaxID=1603897 RepID=UPI0006C9271E|nr:cell division protein FtsZ [Erythrobacter sp. SG61-1L]KPL69696.1 cell division protein FtsZ [Erythrobacter sp. SG61-1L]